MRKTIKSLLSLVLALSLLLAITGCNSKTDVAEDNKANEENAVEKVVEAFFDDYKDMKFEDALEYVDKDAGLYEDIEELQETMPFGEIAKESPRLAEKLEDMSGDLFGAIAFEIKDVSIDGDKAVVDIETNVEAAETVGEELGSIGEERIQERLENLSETELAELELLSEEEQIEFGMELAIEVMEEIFDELIEKMEDADMEAGTVELMKYEDEWKITDME